MKISWWKKRIKIILDPLARHMGHISPDVITVATFLISIGVAVLVYMGKKDPLFYPVAGILLVFQVLGDYLDGLVARTYKKQTARGALMDRIFDRMFCLYVSL